MKRCRVFPDDQGIADVVFGKEPPKPSKSTEDGGDKDQHKGITPYYLRPTCTDGLQQKHATADREKRAIKPEPVSKILLRTT